MVEELPVGRRFGQVVHVAYLVPDIDVGMRDWVRQLGIGPWTCIRDIELDATYNDEPLTLQIHEALAYAGSLQIQLVQSLNDFRTDPVSSRVKSNAWSCTMSPYFSDDGRPDCPQQRSGVGDFARCAARRAPLLLPPCRSPRIVVEASRFPLLSDATPTELRDGSWDGARAIRNID